jgi:hypothetical protein
MQVLPRCRLLQLSLPYLLLLLLLLLVCCPARQT